MISKSLRTVFLYACALTSVACGAGSNIPAQRFANTEASSDEVTRYAAKLAELKAHPRARMVSAELEKASGWLDTAKALANENPDSKRVRLHLDAVKAELVLVQSSYAMRDAHDAAGTTETRGAKTAEPDEQEEKKEGSK
jgi:hypothetical protein